MSLRYMNHCDTLSMKDVDTGSRNASMGKPFYKVEIPSTYEAMTDILDSAVEAMIREGCICDKDMPCMRLCLEEALVNAVRHGNSSDEGRKVSVEIFGNGEDCTIRVGDEGSGFSPESIRPPCCDQMGGRGIVLIRHYMDKVKYIKKDSCLEMTFRRKCC